MIKDLRGLFFDSSNRPKITPLNESAVQRFLEEKYDRKDLTYALEKLQDKKLPKNKRIICWEENRKLFGKIKFYYPALFKTPEHNTKIREKIFRRSQIIERYSRIENITMLGNHLHYLVKNELKANNFEILGEKTNRFENNMGDSSHTIDFIARNKQKKKTIGVEIKNTLDIIPKKELDIKISICESLKITPVFACRWLKPHREKIRKKGGFPWEFKKQLYPFGQEKLVMKLKKTMNLPVEIAGEIPEESRKNFQDWLNYV